MDWNDAKDKSSSRKMYIRFVISMLLTSKYRDFTIPWSYRPPKKVIFTNSICGSLRAESCNSTVHSFVGYCLIADTLWNAVIIIFFSRYIINFCFLFRDCWKIYTACIGDLIRVILNYKVWKFISKRLI